MFKDSGEQTGLTASYLIFVVDPDEPVREAISLSLSVHGFQVRSFPSFESFLMAIRSETPACIVLDLDLRDQSGLAALQKLHAANCKAPIVAVSGCADIPAAVQVMKSGAADFLLKPFDAKHLAARVKQAIAQNERARKNPALAREASIYDRLTKRERDVLHYLVHGMTNSQIGQHLGISPRTVEVHRVNTMRKLQVRNIIALIRLVSTQEAAA